MNIFEIKNCYLRNTSISGLIHKNCIIHSMDHLFLIQKSKRFSGYLEIYIGNVFIYKKLFSSSNFLLTCSHSKFK